MYGTLEETSSEYQSKSGSKRSPLAYFPSAIAYLTLSRFHDCSYMSNQPKVFFHAKWFYPFVAHDLNGIAAEFADPYRNLPMRIPMHALLTPDWRLEIAVSHSYLPTTVAGTHSAAIDKFMNAVSDRFDIMVTDRLVPKEYSSDT